MTGKKKPADGRAFVEIRWQYLEEETDREAVHRIEVIEIGPGIVDSQSCLIAQRGINTAAQSQSLFDIVKLVSRTQEVLLLITVFSSKRGLLFVIVGMFGLHRQCPAWYWIQS